MGKVKTEIMKDLCPYNVLWIEDLNKSASLASRWMVYCSLFFETLGIVDSV